MFVLNSRYRRQFLFVKARNNQVKKGLQDAYATKVPTGKLEVFCVSNITYEKYSRKGNPNLVRASGIPALRSFCYSVTAQKQLLQAKNFLNTRLGSFLNSIQIWVDSIEDGLNNGRTRALQSKASIDAKFVALIHTVCLTSITYYKYCCL